MIGGMGMNITVHTRSLRIQLSEEELHRHGLCFARLEHSDPQTAGFLKKLYLSGKQMCAFAAGSEELLIEIFPAPDGGAVFYFTPETPQRQEETAKLRVRKSEIPRFCTKFSHLDALLGALEAARPTAQQPKSAIYEAEGGYYLFLPDTPALRRAVSEYGGQSAAVSESALREHGRLICADAAKQMRTFWSYGQHSGE